MIGDPTYPIRKTRHAIQYEKSAQKGGGELGNLWLAGEIIWIWLKSPRDPEKKMERMGRWRELREGEKRLSDKLFARTALINQARLLSLAGQSVMWDMQAVATGTEFYNNLTFILALFDPWFCDLRLICLLDPEEDRQFVRSSSLLSALFCFPCSVVVIEAGNYQFQLSHYTI